MSKTWTVFWYELRNTVTRRSFILTLILVPLIPAIIVGVLGRMNQGQREAVQEIFTPDISDSLPKAYVDHSGLIQALPQGFPEEALQAYESESAARADLEADKISAYYIVPEDYIQTGEVTIVKKDANPVTGFEQTYLIEEVLRFNLLEADEELYQKFSHFVSYEYVDLAPEPGAQESDSMLAFYLPYGITLLFYMLIMFSASLLLNNISKEKENRVMELLLSSVKPLQMFVGKVLALGLAGLLQTVVWLGAGILILRQGGTSLNIPETLQLSPLLLIWGIVFFLLGYGLYGSLMAGVGALVPKIKEASQATFIMVVPMIIPLMFISALIEEPNGELATVLSLVPFTAPVSMMTRLAAAKVPLWQPLLSAALMLITVIFVMRGVAKLFRAQTLLTGQKFSLQSYIKLLFGKAS